MYDFVPAVIKTAAVRNLGNSLKSQNPLFKANC